jgi:hypothetical protein
MNDVELLKGAFQELGARARFTRRSVDIPGDSRVAWRLSILCLLLQRGRSKTLALEHLHVLWWAVRSTESRSVFLRWFEGEKRPDEFLVRFDPSLTTTVDLAIGQRLAVTHPNGSVQLTAIGVDLASAVAGDPDVLAVEKTFLSRLPVRITQREIQQLLEWS